MIHNVDSLSLKQLLCPTSWTASPRSSRKELFTRVVCHLIREQLLDLTVHLAACTTDGEARSVILSRSPKTETVAAILTTIAVCCRSTCDSFCQSEWACNSVSKLLHIKQCVVTHAQD